MSVLNLHEWSLLPSLSCNEVLSEADISALSLVQVENFNTKQQIKTKLLCLTYTISPNHDAIRKILGTWGSKCDGYLAFSNLSDSSVSAIKVQPNDDWEERYEKIWEKVAVIWAIIAETIIDDYEWFIIGGDDLYLIVENLRGLLQSERINLMSKNGTEPIYLGRLLRKNSYLKFASGG